MQMNLLNIFCRITLTVILFFTTSNLFGASANAVQQRALEQKFLQTTNNDDLELTLGKPIERTLSGNEAHSYKIVLAANQYLHIVVEQRGIDVVVALFAPDGKKIAEVDSPNGTQGPEPLSVLAEAAGNYRLEIRSPEAKAESGRYQAKIDELRTANPQDKSRIAAQKAYAEGASITAKGRAGLLPKAIDKYQEALSLWRTVDNHLQEANMLLYIADAYNSLGEKQKALDYSKQALPLFRAIGDRNGEGNSLIIMGDAYNSLGEKEKALDYYNQVLSLRRIIGDRSGEALALSTIGLVYDSLGEKQKALDYFNLALTLRRAVGDRPGEARTLHGIGAVYSSMGERLKAQDFYNQALSLYRTIGSLKGEANTLLTIGVVYFTLGETYKALDFYNQALPILKEVGDRKGEAQTLTNIGQVYNLLGEKQKALDFFNQALPISRAVSDRLREANTLSRIGQTYSSLGETQRALDFYNQALPIFKEVGYRIGEAQTLTSIGGVYNLLGEKQKALDFFNQALSLSRAVIDRPGETMTLANIGAIYSSIGETQKALDFYNQSLSLSRLIGDRPGESNTLSSIGAVYYSMGERQKALDFYNQALPLIRIVGNPQSEANTIAKIALVERDRGNVFEARERIEEALTIVESLRTKIASQELRSSYFATVQQFYDIYIDLLMRLHKQQPSAGLDGTALQASERARARSLLEVLAEANADIRQGVDPILLERERFVQQLLAGKSERLTRISNDEKLKAQKPAAEKEVNELLAQYQEIEAQIRVKSPRYAALTQPVPSNLAEIQQLLDKDTVLLEYSLGEERSYLWLVTPQSLKSYELPKRSVIEETANRLISAITVRNNPSGTNEAEYRKYQAAVKQADAEYPKISAELSQMILGQNAPEIEGKRLLIVGDGALQYVPFAALEVKSPNSKKRLLIETNEIVSLPSASTLAVLRREEIARQDRRTYTKTVAVFADPVFDADDKRVSADVKSNGAENKSIPTGNMTVTDIQSAVFRSMNDVGLNNRGGLRRLGASKDEAEAIRNAAGDGQATIALGFDASRERVMMGNFADYRIVHFATHGLLNEENPELSGVVLSLVDAQGKAQNGFLRLNEIYNLNLPVEMVVLSACETGLGKKIKGEGLVGLTRGFMYAGAPRVVASLWSVDDFATKELMQIFYQKMLRENLSPAAALRAAQNEIRSRQQWRSPVYWAGFVLQGEWRKSAPNRK